MVDHDITATVLQILPEHTGPQHVLHYVYYELSKIGKQAIDPSIHPSNQHHQYIREMNGAEAFRVQLRSVCPIHRPVCFR